ncbi:nitrous oxide reductase accessory protein NosL [Sulfitobacter sp. F26169L]|uniref:nitrous oxide reductase accessory protein NosL n=1 Tax=Sulfitobacter sp. F26169L TaxID=2996015 RepID=UPI002260BAB9|nr:nitrous oxide reductase accessory protein NosL [Sulfitobacter sp. F26169L]MCX7567755.1 nitrous oxide reductase accessory protein NosL [Sulfitobacter sp. F26169L]
MIRLLCILALVSLVACKEEAAQDTSPLPLTVEAVGHFCQMNLFEHEGPKGQAHLNGLPQMPLFFSQVRDVVAYLRLPEQTHEVLAVWVNDMGAPEANWSAPGTTNWIDAEEAHYVVGSRLIGGMGAPELVPFSDAAKARAFATENGGKVMRLTQIPDEAVLAPVTLEGESDDADFEQRLRALSRKSGD